MDVRVSINFHASCGCHVVKEQANLDLKALARMRDYSKAAIFRLARTPHADK